jgi:hypothetical protein
MDISGKTVEEHARLDTPAPERSVALGTPLSQTTQTISAGDYASQRLHFMADKPRVSVEKIISEFAAAYPLDQGQPIALLHGCARCHVLRGEIKDLRSRIVTIDQDIADIKARLAQYVL